MDNLVATNSPQQNFPLLEKGDQGGFSSCSKVAGNSENLPSPLPSRCSGHAFSKRGTLGNFRVTGILHEHNPQTPASVISALLSEGCSPLKNRCGPAPSSAPRRRPSGPQGKERYFEKYGIKNLEVIQFSGGQPVTRALIGGDIQISTTGGAAVVNARLKGADPVIIARTVGVFPYTLYVSKDIRDAGDLKNKKLAVSTVGGSGYVAMQYALRKIGLDPDKDVAMLQVGDFGTRLAALAAGTVQGTLLLPPFTLRARELGLRPLYDLVGSGIQYPINQITARQSFIKSQRETVKNFMKGFVSGLARFRTDREFGARVLGKNLRETDPKILQETYDFWLKVFPRIPNPGPEDATVFLEFMQIKEQHDWREFVDTSVMDELEREGFLSSVYK